MAFVWRIVLFDGPRLIAEDGTEVRRFRSQRVAALLAYLALRIGRDVPREELTEALWPEEDPLVTANRLRVSLTSLRHQLEPPGVTRHSVIDATRNGYLRLRRETCSCDTDAFEAALKAGRRQSAATIASGPLLPGFYDDWIRSERERVEAILETFPAPARPQEPETAGAESAAATAESESPPDASVAPKTVAPETVAPAHRLPLFLTRFFGRERERDTLARLLENNRLVSVVASGGMGKTRLAVETLASGETPAVFVALADLPDPRRLRERILETLDIRGRRDGDLDELLVTTLSRRGPLVLLLDNAEHLTDDVAELVAKLLGAVGTLRVLVTSRQRVELPGEAILTLDPLEPPPVVARADRLAEFPAVALFVDRARAVHPDFVLAKSQVAAVVALCLRLEGIPLALELAAARIHVQTPARILESLIESPTELSSRQRTLPARHRSLRAVVRSSLDLLTPALQDAFAALSVFVDGWTAEAAAAVLGIPDARETLADLQVRSLILRRKPIPTLGDAAVEDEGDARFALLETLRQFGAAQLDDTGETVPRARHAAYFLRLASAGDEHDVRTLDPLETEIENLERALEFAWEHARDGVFWDGLTGFLTFTFVRGHHRRASLWADRAVQNWRDIEPVERRLECLHRAMMLYNDYGRWDEIDRLAEDLGDEARRHFRPRWAIEAKTHRSYTSSQRSRHADAVARQREALADARSLGNRKTLIRALVSANRVINPLARDLAATDPDGSLALWREAESVSREALSLESPFSRYQSNIHMGLYLALGGQASYEDAYAMLKASQKFAWDLRAMALLMYSFYFEQGVEMQIGSMERAALLCGAFQRLREQMGYAHPSSGEEETWRARIEASLPPDVYARQMRRAWQLPLGDLVEARTWNQLIAGKDAAENFAR